MGVTTGPADGELVPLGDGSAGEVLAGVDGATGEAFAVKVLPGPLDARTRADLDAELRALTGAARHAPILAAGPVVDLGDGRQGLRMELCSQSLAELVAAFGPLPVDDCVALGTALARALAAAHQAGVLHGSVTPGNVLFRADGEPVLADFGLVLRRIFPAPGTSHDERSDLYGLGKVLHLALTGRYPDTGARLPAGVPPALAELVGALLAADPARRPARADAVVEALTCATPVGPRPLGEPVLVIGPPRRSRSRVVPAVVAAAVALLAVAATFRLNEPDDLDVPGTSARAVVTAAPASSGPAVLLELTAVTDRGDVADLTWRGDETLTYAVLLAGEGELPRTILAQRVTSVSVPIDPVRRYCLRVQGTDGVHIYTSAPEPIRGAVCDG